MRRIAAAAVLVALVGAAGRAEEPAPRLRWDREGLAAVLDAAAEAKPAGKRLLLGLSGSPT